MSAPAPPDPTRAHLATAAGLWMIVAVLALVAGGLCAMAGLARSGGDGEGAFGWFLMAGNALVAALAAWTVGLFARLHSEP